jgi:hypothetical protein
MKNGSALRTRSVTRGYRLRHHATLTFVQQAQRGEPRAIILVVEQWLVVDNQKGNVAGTKEVI